MRRFIRQSETTSGSRHPVTTPEVSENKAGFTIVELLTVMSIIIILIGILVPSLNMVSRYAKDVKQKAQFHSIEVALELFKSDFEGYPDSSTFNGAGYDEIGNRYPGATRLCEAMVGQDLLGFHPGSCFTSNGKNVSGTIDFYPDAPDEDNLRARRGPYLQLEKANAYKLSDIYGDAGTAEINPGLFVLCDEYARVKNAHTGKKIGMPILYYKANTAGTKHDVNDLPTFDDDEGQIYNYFDNDYLVGLGMPGNPPASYGGDPKHPMFDEPERFYKGTWNEKIPLTAGRPYRSDSYILLSAGFDGQYGTPDDIFNFEKE